MSIDIITLNAIVHLGGKGYIPPFSPVQGYIGNLTRIIGPIEPMQGYIGNFCRIINQTESWISILRQTFNEIQKLLNKTNGRIIGDVMTPAPLVVQETTNLEDAARSVR